ncbi:MAG: peptide chain release factor 2 [bacterium]|nr:peptide chain release factor 2 [bacterium]
MSELLRQLDTLVQRLNAARDFLDLAGRKKEIAHLEEETMRSGFWDDRDRATEVTRRMADLRSDVDTWEHLHREATDLLELAGLDADDQSESIREELEPQVLVLEHQLQMLEVRALLSGKHDADDAIIAIHAGAGGTEAQDWAAMILRMLLRYAEAQGWTARVVDEHRGEEAGIKSAVVDVRGRFAYGLLQSEVGVHRLVRLSPYDSDHRRHTSFCLVEVLPDLGEATEVNIDPKDIRIDTFLSSGHGGQSVQTTYSAVRIVHLPTGIIVSCQNERSQQQNRQTAMRVLQARLQAIEEAKLAEEKQVLRGEYKEAAWGNQIRSYVLHPYKMVKDLRSRYEESNPDDVLNGKLDRFVEEYLRWKAEGKPDRKVAAES